MNDVQLQLEIVEIVAKLASVRSRLEAGQPADYNPMKDDDIQLVLIDRLDHAVNRLLDDLGRFNGHNDRPRLTIAQRAHLQHHWADLLEREARTFVELVKTTVEPVLAQLMPVAPGAQP
jgi:hypothetical protein